MNETETYEPHKTNRQKRQTPLKGGKYWCDKCDRNVTGDYEKCSVCGYRPKSGRLKRERI